MSECAVSGCERPVVIKSRGLCGAHYKRFLRHGDPTAGAAYSHQPLAARISDAVARDAETGCWNWQLALNAAGYGIIGVNCRPRLAHRIAYEEFVGSIPNGLELDHLCKNKRCVNPEHLEAVTRSENVRRGWPDRRRRAELFLQ